MKKIIEVREFSTPIGKEYNGDLYPALGIYHNVAGWFLVYQTDVGTRCVINLGAGFTPPILMEDYVEPKLEQVAGGITAADLLKAVAITQKPEMAKELLR